jgi:type III secretion system FlhB-like substrate exporter
MEKDKKVIANALKYDSDENSAPQVIAKGNGYMAKKMKEIADENDVPIYRDEKLNNLNNCIVYILHYSGFQFYCCRKSGCQP